MADYDRIGSSDPIGRVEIGYNRRGGPCLMYLSLFIITILPRTRAETLEGDGGESKATHSALARPQGESESTVQCCQ